MGDEAEYLYEQEIDEIVNHDCEIRELLQTTSNVSRLQTKINNQKIVIKRLELKIKLLKSENIQLKALKDLEGTK